MTARHGLAAAAVLGLAALTPEIASAENTATTTQVTVEVVEPGYDEWQQLLDDEARAAMNAGHYRRAWHFFWRLLEIDPLDMRALREAGRVAQALGEFRYAADAFARVDDLDGTVADPELHFLRGEALYALGEHAEAEVEWKKCERELSATTVDRRGALWLARIDALRGNLDDALTVYRALMPADPTSPEYAEVIVYVTEAYTMSKDWARAERTVRKLLDQQPEHEQGRALLAWILEARGEDEEVLALRAEFAEDWTDHPRKTVDYARALERVHDYPGALSRYREAHELGVDEVDGDIGRLKYLVAPEVSVGGSLRSDVSGDVSGWTTGLSVSLPGRWRAAVTALRDESSGGITMQQDTSTAASAWGLHTTRGGAVFGGGVTGWQNQRDQGVGAGALARTRANRPVQLHVRADYQQPWRESSSTVREGGVYDAVQAQVYAEAFTPRVLLSAGVLGRRLGLAPLEAGMASPDAAYQLFGSAGVDVTVHSDPTRVARGQILDGELLAPRSLTSATVVSYRHYELTSDDPFGPRLVLVERSRIDELSAAVRSVVDPRGIVGVEARGGVGYDWIRDMRLLRAGASVLLSATAGSRLTFDYDVATETATGLSGRRHAGSVVFHLDL